MIALLVGCISPIDFNDWSDRTRVTGPFLALSTAGDRNCALGTSGGDGDEGSVVCWGRDNDQLLETASNSDGSLLAIGADTACVGGATGYDCWGLVTPTNGSDGPLEIRAMAMSRNVNPNDPSLLCVSTDATTQCYGWDSGGGSFDSYGEFEGSFDTLAVGGGHIVGLRGERMFESLIVAPSDQMVRMSEVEPAVDVALFGSQQLLITDEGASTSPVSYGDDLPGDWIAGDIGEDWACVTEGGPITCFGNAPVDGISAQGGGFIDVGVGNSHVCGLTEDGHIVCEGDDRYGQAGEPPFSEVVGG